jgi:monoamine oxidase
MIVLGQKLLPDSTLPYALEKRLTTAFDYIFNQRNSISYIIFSGGDTAKINKTEANAMRERWWELLESAKHRHQSPGLLLEEKSLTTTQNVHYCIPLLRNLATRKIVLVTSDFHMARSKLHFEQGFRTEAVDLLPLVPIHGAVSPVLREERDQLFEKEHRFLTVSWLKLEVIPGLVFKLPTEDRRQQAVRELEQLHGQE